MLSVNTEKLKEGYILRPATMDDAPGAVEIMRACDIAVDGASEQTLDDLVNEWELPDLSLEHDVRVISAPDGRLIGYGIVLDASRPVTPEIDVYIHPDFWGDDEPFGSSLMHWVEERCRENLARVPADARVAIHAYTYSSDTYYKSVLERAGLQLIRHFFRMRIELDHPIPQPVWPEGITLKTFEKGGDKRPVLEALRASFQDHWGYLDSPFDAHYERWSHFWGEDFDPSLWFLAMDGDKIAGICLTIPRRGDDPDAGWVRTLGVTRPYRRTGVGMALLLHAFNELQARGKKFVALGVDASSLTGASLLYEKAGMHVAVRYDLFEKELRPGVEYGTQSVE